MSAITNDKEVETTTIKQETVKFNLEEGMSVFMSNNRPQLPSTGQIPDIRNFLSRPYNFSSYTWSTSQTPGTDIFDISIINTINSINMYTTKMKGFRNWKFTVCFKMVIAPSPFHAGALRLSWKPWTASTNSNRGNMHKGLIPNSQLPGIMLTCEDNSAEIKIPYIGPVYGYDKSSTGENWAWGNLRLCVYSSLATGTGSNNVAIDGYIWLEDIELSGMTAQSKYSASVKKKSRMVITDKEIGDGSGPISRVLGSGAVLANRLGDFPVLTPFFKPAAWVLNALRGSAEAFGYSKPTTGERQELSMMVRNQDAFSPNTNGIDNCANLSVKGDAKTTMNTMLQLTKFDESSIDFIKRQWSYYEAFTVSTSNVPNDILYSKLIAPRNLNKSYLMPASSTTNFSVYWQTPVAYLGEVFESYRGDIEVRFVFVKTGYHACQVEVAFSMDQVTTSNTEYYLREIVDIQAGNEICFVLPYNRVEPFLSTSDNFGMLQVSLVNTLQAPTSVSNTISIMVFFRGGDNLEFSRPSTSVPIPVMGPQGAFQEESQEAMCDKPENIGNSNSVNSLVVTQYTVGEDVKSLKQLSNRYTKIYWSYWLLASKYLTMDPHWYGITTATLGTYYTLSFSYLALDYFSRFSALFLGHNGSIKLKIKSRGAVAPLILRSSLLPFNPNGGNADVAGYGGYSSDALFSDYSLDHNLISNGIRVPQYSKYFNYPHVNYASSINPAWYNQTCVILESGDTTNMISNGNTLIYRATGEDFQFQFFLGIPTVLTSTTAS